ncbi:MarR family winged helix-turn-helix transcriptional regulator [Lysobacter sp. GX 14042]|uniref:MarR family winged helix-turn-helix transcriptional regulator n=1 Tax=Lysobacter sp. GX 14042 TaxID=2907155 RepID=UPI001F2DC8F3|nr:MarR family winged helix-turn-helix transcriptional regulator [Lysobacter sp. GX 14042]MCE7031991.1 MarR family winged helix-turn-helix transcriptional regulator [Lysobacter sp. GX 14042]
MAVADRSAPHGADQRGADQHGPGQRGSTLELENFLPYRLSVLSNRLSSAIARIYADRLDLGITEWRVMAVLGLSPGLSAGELAQRTAMDKVAVSRAVARLVEAGRLEREVDAGDRRRAVLHLSPAGQAIYAEVAPLALEFERRLFGHLEPREREALFALLDRLDAVDIEVREPAPAARRE